MSKKSAIPQSPKHIMIYDEDWEYLESRFSNAGMYPVGVSKVIKSLIHKQVLLWREAENAALTAVKRRTLEQRDANPTHIDSTDGSPT